MRHVVLISVFVDLLFWWYGFVSAPLIRSRVFTWFFYVFAIVRGSPREHHGAKGNGLTKENGLRWDTDQKKGNAHCPSADVLRWVALVNRSYWLARPVLRKKEGLRAFLRVQV